jgi:hypothetical protein
MRDTLSIGAASVDITPRAPLCLGGFKRRQKPFRRVADGLEANVLFVQREDVRAVLVTCDLLYPGDALRAAVLEATGLAEPELFLAASHTHFAPMTQFGSPALGVPDPGYVAEVGASIASAVAEARERVAPCSLTYSEAAANHSVNRRLNRWRVGPSGITYSSALAPNPAGERDETIRLVRVVGKEGATRAVLWNYACHPTGWPEMLSVSSEFPGTVRRLLRARHGGIPVLFLQGCSGDTRPPFRRRMRSALALVRRALAGPQFGTPSLDEWHAWATGLGGCVLEADSLAAPSDVSRVSHARVPLMMDELAHGHPDATILWMHAVEFGDIRIVGFSAEPVAGIARIVRGVFGPTKLLLAGCMDQTYGYLPVDSMLREGGYEVVGFREPFAFEGSYTTGIDERVERALHDLRGALGRNGPVGSNGSPESARVSRA